MRNGWAAFSGWLWVDHLYGSYCLGLGKMREPGSGFLPFMAGGFICFMAIIVLFQSFTSKKEARAKLAALWKG